MARNGTSKFLQELGDKLNRLSELQEEETAIKKELGKILPKVAASLGITLDSVREIARLGRRSMDNGNGGFPRNKDGTPDLRTKAGREAVKREKTKKKAIRKRKTKKRKARGKRKTTTKA